MRHRKESKLQMTLTADERAVLDLLAEDAGIPVSVYARVELFKAVKAQVNKLCAPTET